jgi:hypothetical protein
VPELAFLGGELLHDLIRRYGGSTGIDRAKALVRLIFRLGQEL